MSLARFSIKNTVLVNLVMATILIIGTYSWIVLPREAMPEVSFNWAFIVVPYPGAAPEEVELLVTKPIEEAIQDVENIDMITSSSDEGVSFISVKFEQNLPKDDFERRYQEIVTEVNGVRLPSGAEEPEIQKLDSNTWMPVISVVVSGDVPEAVRKQVAEDLEEELQLDPNVGKITIAGMRDREIWVEIDPDRMDRLGVTLNEIIGALNAQNINVPGGTVRTGRSEYLLRTLGRFQRVEEIEDVVVRAYPNGNLIRVRDVATVHDVFEEASTISRLNGRPSITLNVSKKSGASTIDVVEMTRGVVENYRKTRLPEGVYLDLINDSSIFINDSLEQLQSNALFGIAFVWIALWLFVGWRSALVVVVGMPVTFAATLTFMNATGRSLNGNSLFGLVLVLGMIVDHAIVMVENCYRHLHMGKRPVQAVIDGIGEVFTPVLAATATTIAAFLPLMLMPGLIGSFMRIIPLVVTLALLASLFEAFVILPSHVAEWSRPENRSARRSSRFFKAIRMRYVHFLAATVRRRYWVVVVFLLLIVLSAGIIPLVGVDMFGEDPMSAFYVNLWMPPGTDIDETDRVLRQLEQIALSLPEDELEAVVATTGYLIETGDTTSNSRVGQLVVDVVEDKDRDRSIQEIIDDLRLRCASVTGYERLAFVKIESGPPTGKAVEVKVKGKRLEDLRAIANELKAALAEIPGVSDISDDFSPGKEEIRIVPDEERARLHGLTAMQVAGLIHTAVQGTVATTFRDGDEDIDVLVKLADAQDYSLDRIEALKIATPSGALIPLRDVARLEVRRGYASIPRFEVERAITVSADVNSDIISPVEVNRIIVKKFEDIGQRYPGYRLDFRGEFAEFNKAFSSLTRLFVLGNFIIFILLTAQFKSFTQPFIILFTVPFAFVGAMLGLIVTNEPFSIMTLYGIVALAGIVVNDSIVLIDFINLRRRQGAGKWRAILEGGRLRLRPIILTTVTTVAGLLPMATGLGGSSASWKPLATTIIWGLSMATFLTLFVIPSLYAISEDIAWIRRWRERGRAKREAADRDVSPAELVTEAGD